MNLSERIFKLRRQSGLSQEELAGKLGVSRQAVGKWENGTAVPELDKVLTLSKLFAVPLSELLGLDGESATEIQTVSNANFSDQQRKELETIISQYAQEQEKQNKLQKIYIDAYKEENEKRALEYEIHSRRQNIISAILALLLIAVFIFAAVKIAALNEQLYILSSDINGSNNAINLKISDMESSITNLLKKQNSLFEKTNFELTNIVVAENTVDFTLFAIPKEISDNMELEFILTNVNSNKKYSFAAERTELTFSAKATLPMDCNFTITAYVTNGDSQRSEDIGSISTQKEYFSANYGLKWFSNSNAYANPTAAPALLYRAQGTIILNCQTSTCIMPDIAKISAAILINGEIASETLLDLSAGQWSKYFSFTSPYPCDNRSITIDTRGTDGIVFSTEFTCDAVEPKVGDTVSLILRLTDELGLKYEAELESHTFDSENSISGMINENSLLEFIGE